jgi:hypothetical protein
MDARMVRQLALVSDILDRTSQLSALVEFCGANRFRRSPRRRAGKFAQTESKVTNDNQTIDIASGSSRSVIGYDLGRV